MASIGWGKGLPVRVELLAIELGGDCSDERLQALAPSSRVRCSEVTQLANWIARASASACSSGV